MKVVESADHATTESGRHVHIHSTYEKRSLQTRRARVEDDETTGVEDDETNESRGQRAS